MFPVTFGDPAAPLYGIYHRPDSPAAGQRGVVLCQPVFHEATNTHRAMRSLAERFAQSGIHALRFDYRGTGDSAGNAADCTVEGWVSDIVAAVEELRSSRGLVDVGLVGLRLGASLAATAAADLPGLPFLVLWEPVVEGRPYLEALHRMQEAWVDFETEQRPGARSRATPHEILGHPLSPALAAGLEAVDLAAAAHSLAERVLLVDEGACDRIEPLGERSARAGGSVETQRIDGGRTWSREMDGEQAQVPRDVLTGIVDWVGREAGS